MDPSDTLSEEEIRSIIRDEIIGTNRTLIETIFWTILSVFAVLVGLQLLQLALSSMSGLAVVGFCLAGGLVTVASLYLLHWK